MFEAKDTKLCQGCLSSDRKLTSITAGDLILYYTLLADDRKPDALTTPGIDLCWECKGILRRARMFRAQVQRAQTILQEMLGLPLEKATLSSLTIQHKSKYDAIFEETKPNDQPLFFKKKMLDITFDKIVIPTKYKKEMDENILKDTSLLASNSNPTNTQQSLINKLDYNSDSEIEDSDHYEIFNTKDRDSSSSEPELTIKRITPQKISEDVKIFKRTNLNDKKSKTKPESQYKVIRTNRVVTNNVKLAPIIKTPVIAKLELELQKFMQNAKNNVTTAQKTPKQKKPKRESTEENTPKEKKAKRECAERKTKNAGSSKDTSEFKNDSDHDDQDDSNSSPEESPELEASALKRDRDKGKKPESDPDFSVDEDEESDSETEGNDREGREETLDENGKIKIPKRYRREIERYEHINDVLSCFTEIEMSVDDIKSILEKEDAIVDEKRPIKCSVCGRRFILQRHLRGHALRLHKKSHPQQFRKGGYYNPPPTMPEEPRLWRCNVCSKLLRKAHVLAHMNEFHRTQYSCNGCEWSTKIFWIKADLVEHYNEIHKQFFCDTCGVRKRTKSRLEYHVQKAHLKRKPVLPQQCPHCNRSYVHASVLRKHIQRRHLEPEPAELRYCVECDVTYPTISRLQLHFYKKHSAAAQTKYPCSECGRELANKTNLRNHHALFHAGRTEYRCHICGKYFSKKLAMTNHVKSTHFNIKQPKTKPCPICGRMFGSNRTLRQHIYTHTGERPYKCAHCDAAYTQPYCLRNHLLKQHGIHQVVHVVPL